MVTLTGVLSMIGAGVFAVPAMADNGASSSASSSASAGASVAAGNDEPRGTPASGTAPTPSGDTSPTPSARPASTVSEPAGDPGSGGTPRAASSQQQQQQQDGAGGGGSGSSSSSSSSSSAAAAAAAAAKKPPKAHKHKGHKHKGDVAVKRAKPAGGRGGGQATLPFTGWTGALPTVILAAFMLTAGLLLRRATASSR